MKPGARVFRTTCLPQCPGRLLWPSRKPARSSVRDGQILIVQRGEGGLWERFWEFPTIHLEGANPAGRPQGSTADMAAGIKSLTGIRARVGPAIKSLSYSVTNHRVKLIVHLAEASADTPALARGLIDVRWSQPEKLGEVTFSSVGRRVIAWINHDPTLLKIEK